MSAVPNRQPDQRPARQHNPLLVDALREDAAAHARLKESLNRIAVAQKLGAEEFSYVWHTPDGRDAEMRGFFRVADDVEILAGQLTQIDYRQPTVQERAHYESLFDSELRTFGELWMSVASFLWERR